MMNWCRTVLGALGLVLLSITPAWAQGAAKPQEPSGSGWFALLIIFVPVLFVIIVLTPSLRRAKRNVKQIERSLAMSEESLLLARERVALQKETNRLLGKLIEELGRD